MRALLLVGLIFLLCACADSQVAVRATGQVETGFGYQKR